MVQLLLAIFFGLVTGALYALAALGVSVVYRASRVLNFALPGTATLAAFVGWEVQQHGAPFVLVALATIGVSTLASVLVYSIYVRWLSAADVLTLSVATLGVLLVLQGLVSQHWGTQPRSLAPAVGGFLSVGSTQFAWSDFLALAVVALCTLGLFWFTGRTRTGAALRAASSGPLTAQLLGISTQRIQVAAWAVSGALGGVAALFVIPHLYLDPNVYVQFVMVGFAAVVMGGFLSATGVLASGVVIGIVTSLLATYVSGTLTAAFTFVVVALVLCLRPHGLFGTVDRPVPEPVIRQGRRPWWTWGRPLSGADAGTDAQSTEPAAVRTVTRRQRRFLGMPVFVVIALLAGSAPYWADVTLLSLLTSAAATYVAVEGVGLLGGDSGRLSLGHGGLMAVGAYGAAYVGNHSGLSLPLALVLGTVAGSLCGVVIGVITSRLDGVYLAVFTLAFALAVPDLINTFDSVTGGANGVPFPVPDRLLDINNQFWFVWAIAVAVAALVGLVRRTRVGRAWHVVRDTQTGASSLGFSTFSVRLGAFVVSSALAALGGALAVIPTAFVSPTTFGVFLSIYLVVAVVVGGRGSSVGALLGAAFITLVPYYTGATSSPQVIFGLALLVVVALAPEGVTRLLLSVSDRLVAVAPSRGGRGGSRPASNRQVDRSAP